MKGRSILLGDGLVERSFKWAEGAELGSVPPYMEVARVLDALGSLHGHAANPADA